MTEIQKLDFAFICAKSRIIEQCRVIAAKPDEATGEVMLALYQMLCDYKELHDEVLLSMSEGVQP